MKKYIVLVIFAAVIKMVGIEGSFALNFTKFSYHNFFGKDAGGIVLSLLLMFGVHLAFYAFMICLVYLFENKKENQVLYFIEGMIISVIETAFYNLGRNMLIETLPSFLTVILFNIILSYTINISVLEYKKERRKEDCSISS